MFVWICVLRFVTDSLCHFRFTTRFMNRSSICFFVKAYLVRSQILNHARQTGITTYRNRDVSNRLSKARHKVCAGCMGNVWEEVKKKGQQTDQRRTHRRTNKQISRHVLSLYNEKFKSGRKIKLARCPIFNNSATYYYVEYRFSI